MAVPSEASSVNASKRVQNVTFPLLKAGSGDVGTILYSISCSNCCAREAERPLRLKRDNGLVWSRAEVAARASAWHRVTCFIVPLCVAAYARPRNCPVARGFQFAVSQELSKERETRFWKAELDKALNEKNYFVQRCAQAERERSIAIAELRRHQTLEAQRAQAALLIVRA
ncbi:hypothetical protein HaLaN_13528 [Haematococcus lacustris]|uniref:Uncharacterized protein n=1 Tax=Haematococcus lacustris TaxID=44745 RepID=A0A699Z328_HAELA|nr:hypothetical protein HaLaN_13528 [Haematococcus lacustris]